MSTQSARICDDDRLTRAIRVYEQLSPTTLDALESLFAPDAHFIDPFNDVIGRATIRKIFEHMYATLDQPRFDVLEGAIQGCNGFLLWDLHFRSRGQTHRIHGMSRLVFDDQGRITLHHDHWDPARQLYEGVPVLGALMRMIRRRLSATGS
ncbi:nuclear transport factor 2 family protein [Roseateles amylovorans]|uniref:Nuclear transport factor 2 family protein n=1 Tax=Roseateles amylovorans TaxID=2978473 RepID=A0ABY6AVF5_9BURK|nr:nuclear transport factor 2 family protein [Roseateles amylovorans]UXH76359.1 nuclear transport factor 2 family protein [Roseateles amylovorans]